MLTKTIVERLKSSHQPALKKEIGDLLVKLQSELRLGKNTEATKADLENRIGELMDNAIHGAIHGN